MLAAATKRRFSSTNASIGDSFAISSAMLPKQGWSGIKNGELLELAEKEFDVFVTVDRKLAAKLTIVGTRLGSSLNYPSRRKDEGINFSPELPDSFCPFASYFLCASALGES